VQDRVGAAGILLEDFDSLRRGEKQKVDLPPLRLALHFVHDWQGTVRARADHQAVAPPGDILFNRERRVSWANDQMMSKSS